MTCKTMKQNENDQNHKKESTPVVDDKPNGKSQMKRANRRSGSSADSRIYDLIGKCGGLPAAAANPQLKNLGEKLTTVPQIGNSVTNMR